MEIENLIKHMRKEAQDYRAGRTLGRAFADAEEVLDEAATALEMLQGENDRLKEEVQQMRWIPVEERLPEEGKRCLLYTPCDRILCVGYYAGKDEWQHRHKWRLVTAMRSTQTLTKKVTHWLPLPKAPKEDNL